MKKGRLNLRCRIKRSLKKSLDNWIGIGPGFSFLGRCNVVTWLLQVAEQTGKVVEEEELVRCTYGAFPF